jgi:hypothetical protein
MIHHRQVLEQMSRVERISASRDRIAIPASRDLR